MKFKLDENSPAELAAEMVAAGCDCQTVVEEGLAGSPDPPLIKHIQAEQRFF
jgi:hypothetical protein